MFIIYIIILLCDTNHKLIVILAFYFILLYNIINGSKCVCLNMYNVSTSSKCPINALFFSICFVLPSIQTYIYIYIYINFLMNRLQMFDTFVQLLYLCTSWSVQKNSYQKTNINVIMFWLMVLARHAQRTSSLVYLDLIQ